MLFFNPRSGGGKAERFKLADEARKRGIEPIELGPPWDLEALVRGALDRGADGLAMAGGDGSQAIVAAIAAERGLPYACIPAGTRNHFALDLGVDRDDVVGALDAFVDGGERTVDLAEVNGRVFVNNVSLGLYAEAVQRRSTATRSSAPCSTPCPTCSAPTAARSSTCAGRARAATRTTPAPWCWSPTTSYRLGRAIGSGTRPRIDDGLLGITAVAEPTGRGERGRSPQRPLRAWSAPTFEVDSDRPIAAGIDGEALMLDAPLRFASGPESCACVSRASTPAPHPRPWSPTACGPACSSWRESPAAAPRNPQPQHEGGPNGPDRDHREGAAEPRGRRRPPARPRRLLARHNDVEFERGGLRFKVHVPDEVDFKFEIEIDDDECETRDRAQMVTELDACDGNNRRTA